MRRLLGELRKLYAAHGGATMRTKIAMVAMIWRRI
jgi:hypothetical protein